MKSYYWHDYETWGATPSVDRPCQFAGVRTDEDLNIIGEPLVMYCRPPDDVWPHPEACLITGITPQKTLADGLPEREFIARIVAELGQPGTCGVGYNSLRFDDEITRYTLFRNFYDPYEREWRNGNSRWDIIDMVRLVYALRPEGIEWPMVDGRPSFKLESLCRANDIAHQSAHDAYSDVAATIALAKLIKDKKPQLYQYVVDNRSKQRVASHIDIAACKPLLHISSRFSSQRGCAGIIAPLAMHPKNKNAVIVYDLSVDPSPLATLSPEQIRQRVFVAAEDLPRGEERLPIKLVHLNKCPILAMTKLLDQDAAARLGIDKDRCEQHWQILRALNLDSRADQTPGAKVQAMYQLDDFAPCADPEQQLYAGFIDHSDKPMMQQVRSMTAADFQNAHVVFEDARLQDMIWRYRGRNFPQSLNEQERQHWHEFVFERLRDGDDKLLSYAQLTARIDELKQSLGAEPEHNITKLALLDDLHAFSVQHFESMRQRAGDI